MVTKSLLPEEVIRVLVVDDHPFFREGIILWMARQKHLACCGWADSADDAFELIMSLAPQLVLLDLQLRMGDGLELLRRVQGIASKPRVIVVSHKDQTIFAERALNAGAMG